MSAVPRPQGTHWANTAWLLAGCSDLCTSCPFPEEHLSSRDASYLVFFSILAMQLLTCAAAAFSLFLFLHGLAVPWLATLCEVRQEHDQASGFFFALAIVPCNGEQINSTQAKKYSCCLLSSTSQSANMSYLALIRPESAQLPGKGIETPRPDPVWLPCSASKAGTESRASGLLPSSSLYS